MIDVAAAQSVFDALTGARRVLLTGPAGPDGDSVGACLTLQSLLRRHGVAVDVAGDMDQRYRWLPGAAAAIPDARVEPVYDAVVVMDGDKKRLHPSVRAAFDAASVRGIVDHHATARPDGYEVAWLDHRVASTCEMLYRAMSHWGEALDPDLALLLYVGSIFDTGGFRYANTESVTHEMAAELLAHGIDHATANARILMERSVAGQRALGRLYTGARYFLGGRLVVITADRELIEDLALVPDDLEGIVDSIVFTHGVEVAALLIHRADRRIKYSLRSRGAVDVSLLAQELSPTGGGHPNAAGATIDKPMAEAVRRLVRLLEARWVSRAG
jgi:bifunctional oligoribonuclease and PAP phosphatase NrnA